MIYWILVSFYILNCLGFVISFLIDNDDFPDWIKVLMAILSPIFAPLILSMAFGMIISAKVKKETNRE